MTSTDKPLKVNYIPMKQGDYELYLFTIPATDLWERVRINKREEDKEIGYQRALSSSRAAAISKYVKAGNPIPLSILISLNDVVKINKTKREITFPASKDSGWVIDGQHRLEGMYKSQTNIQIGVIAFAGLSTEEQIKQFVVINREGKGVPTSLYYDLLKELPSQKTVSELGKERAADIAAALKRDEESTFFNRIVVVTSPSKGQLSLTNFVRKISPLVQLKKGKLELYTEQEQRLIIDNYFHAIRTVFPKDFSGSNPIFFKTIGFGAMINTLPTVFDLSLKHYKAFTIKDACKVLKKVDFFDFSEWNKYGSGNAAESQAGDDLKHELIASFSEGDDTSTIKLK